MIDLKYMYMNQISQKQKSLSARTHILKELHVTSTEIHQRESFFTTTVTKGQS